MIDKMKKSMMQQGMKLLTNPKVMKMMADPRVMKGLMKAMELKGKLQSDIDARLREVAGVLNLATRQEVAALQQTLRQVEAQVEQVSKSVHEHEGEEAPLESQQAS
jgi:predicted glycosyl hydrolase (DUF1957 family)